jgi:hypothetical protein
MSHFEDHVHYRCLNCELIFEEGIADPGPKGEPRCPQCLLLDSEPYQPQEEDFVVTRGTKFR